jgi:paraquat-inducible protein B
MAKPVSKTLIGAFVLGALALICGGIVILGSGALFRDVTDVVMFFDGSVGGLQVGAPVTFRGVAVGEVNRIQIVYEPAKQEFRIPVAAKLYPDRVISLAVSPRPAKLKDLIDMGLRAQLHMQSFITGQLSILLDFFPDEPAVLVGVSKAGFGARVREIPTVPTPIQKIQKSIQEIPLDEVVRDVRDTLNSIRDLLASPALPEILANLKQVSQNIVVLSNSVDARLDDVGSQMNLALKELRTLAASANEQIKHLGPAIGDARAMLQNVNRRVDPLAAEISATTSELRTTIKQSEKAIANIGSMTADNAELRYHLELFLTEISSTARSLRTLTDYLDRYPDSLWRGKPPAQPPGGQR